MEVSKDSKAHITCIRHCHVNNRDRLCRADFTLFVIFRNWPEAKIRKQGKKQHSILQPYRILRMVAAALLIHNIIGNWHTIYLFIYLFINSYIYILLLIFHKLSLILVGFEQKLSDLFENCIYYASKRKCSHHPNSSILVAFHLLLSLRLAFKLWVPYYY